MCLLAGLSMGASALREVLGGHDSTCSGKSKSSPPSRSSLKAARLGLFGPLLSAMNRLLSTNVDNRGNGVGFETKEVMLENTSRFRVYLYARCSISNWRRVTGVMGLPRSFCDLDFSRLLDGEVSISKTGLVDGTSGERVTIVALLRA